MSSAERSVFTHRSVSTFDRAVFQLTDDFFVLINLDTRRQESLKSHDTTPHPRAASLAAMPETTLESSRAAAPAEIHAANASSAAASDDASSSPPSRPPPPPPHPTPRLILAPVDDTDDASRAVTWAIEHLLRANGDDVLHLLHVVPATHPSRYMAYGGPMVWLEDAGVCASSSSSPPSSPPPSFASAPVVAPRPRSHRSPTTPTATRPYDAAMSFPGASSRATYFDQIERDERVQRANDRRNAEAFVARRCQTGPHTTAFLKDFCRI